MGEHEELRFTIAANFLKAFTKRRCTFGIGVAERLEYQLRIWVDQYLALATHQECPAMAIEVQ
ncbi:hypothetical protein D3C80_1895680 [compost metagenome]